jgi:hypothetical protein
MTNTTDTLGFSRLLVKPDIFTVEAMAALGTPESVNYFLGGTSPSKITSGELTNNLSVVQGYIRSANFESGVNGWRLNSVGDLEANSATIRGSIYASTGLIGGWTIETARISQTNTYLSSAGYLSFGSTPPTSYGNNVGVWLGYSSGSKISLYADSSNYLQWNGSQLLIKGTNFELDASGNITANGGIIGGFTIDSTSLYGSTIKTGATVSEGSNGVIMDTAGLRGYSSVLGEVFDLPTDGSAPTFSSGIINSTIFEIQTNAVLRTSETVGDGSANSEGVLINNTGFYACENNQSLDEANVRITKQGNGYFKGTVNASDIVSSNFTGGDINGAVFTGGLIRTAETGQRTEITNQGIQLMNGATASTYGDATYLYGNTTRKYGTGTLGYINNQTYRIPFYINAEQTVADAHFYNRSADPTGPAEVGDLCVVNGRLKICTVSGEPGGFDVVGVQTAVSSPSSSVSPSVSPSRSPSISPSRSSSRSPSISPSPS